MAGLAPYLQLLSLQGLRLAFGTVNLSLTAGSIFGATASVSHGLGAAPQAVLICVEADPGILVAPVTFNWGSSTFTARLYSNSTGGGGPYPCPWIAIG